jgi:hypothetical protein
VNLLRGALLHCCDMPGRTAKVRFSNRPFGVKRFQTIHLYGIGTKALPSWDSKTRWSYLSCGRSTSNHVV